MDVLYAFAILFALAFIVSGLFLELIDIICEIVGTLLGSLLAKLIEGLALLLKYLWVGLLAGSRSAARAILRYAPRLGRGAVRHSKRAWLGLTAAAVFLYFLVDEAVRGPRPDAAPEDDTHKETAQDPYQTALQLLGLPADCSREALARAYKRAISRAHPDKGGTHQQAMEVNMAREIIMNRNGWRK
jgi:hypothetical protein